jgi:hypothetical protein
MIDVNGRDWLFFIPIFLMIEVCGRKRTQRLPDHSPSNFQIEGDQSFTLR